VLAIKAEADATDAMIAPNENGSTMSQSYAIGAQFIRDNVLYKAKVAITSGTAWSSLTLNTDYEVQSDSLVEQINTKQPKTLATPITVNNVQQTTVEGALGAINTDLGSTKQALTNISINGNTNNTGSTITENTVFYLNGALAKAKQSIANGATLTLDTNYVLLPKGGFNEIGQIHAFSNELHLYRIGRLRILSAEGTSISFLTSITLPSVDRPYSNAKGVFDYFGRMGIIIISTDGTITVKQYMNYGESTPADVSSTATLRFIVTWIAN
jgi:hypothetical protein